MPIVRENTKKMLARYFDNKGRKPLYQPLKYDVVIHFRCGDVFNEIEAADYRYVMKDAYYDYAIKYSLERRGHLDCLNNNTTIKKGL